jgi:hypothetical protein
VSIEEMELPVRVTLRSERAKDPKLVDDDDDDDINKVYVQFISHLYIGEFKDA